ncbi:MAG: leucine-rich repeat domain-containing protein [Bacteroidaceae bacterium]|nr:leucine-rich repeat domain-containing protein [Bacteroidaceae bacterium]
MKALRIFTLGLAAISAVFVMAQSPKRVEYFLDTDPGYGLGKLISNIQVGDNLLTFDVSDAPEGAHVLSVRSQDDQGVWSSTMSRPLFIERLQDIVYVEYFFDGKDPGVGKATSIALPQQDYKAHLDFTFEPDITALAIGEHEISVRARDVFDTWTDVMSRKFTIVDKYVPEPPTPVTGDLARLEYFFDTDPGYGKGQTLQNPATGTNVYQMSFDGVEAGAHVLYLRAQEKNGVWSPVMSRPLYVQDSPDERIVALEYFFDDADPGEGKAVKVSLPTSLKEAFTFDVATDGLAAGTHRLNLRVQDDTGQWSVLKSESFEVTESIDIVDGNCINGIYYKFYANTKTAEVISGENRYAGDIRIPSSVKYNGDTYSVTSIGEAAFAYCDELTSITVSNSVISIGERAFRECGGLTSIRVESGNTVFDSRENCNAIIETASNTLLVGCENSFIPNGITAIGGGAFSDRRGLTSITIPEGVKTIAWTAFESTGLTSVTIPNSVTTIDLYAFTNCQLTSLTIPSSVTFIGEGAFGGCYGLKSIQVDKDNKVYDSRGNCNAIIETASNTLVAGCKTSVIPEDVTSIGTAAFIYYSDMASITIPSSVTNIGPEAFWGCGFTDVRIPQHVSSIGYYAFAYCWELKDVYCYAEKVPTTDLGVFQGVDTQNATLHVPASSISAYKAAEPWKNFGKIVALTEEDTGIEDVMTEELSSSNTIYTIDGRRLNTLQKGVNIIRNGKEVKKVYVK